jgi:hypothetical protein
MLGTLLEGTLRYDEARLPMEPIEAMEAMEERSATGRMPSRGE